MKKSKVKDTKKDAESAKQGANAIANLFGGMLGKARNALRGKKNPEPQQTNPQQLEQEREQNFSKVMKQYKKRAR